MKGILLNHAGDLDLTAGRLRIGDTLLQNAAIVLEMNQGECKEDPLLGPSLVRYIRGKYDKQSMLKNIQIHLTRVNINVADLADAIKYNITKQ